MAVSDKGGFISRVIEMHQRLNISLPSRSFIPISMATKSGLDLIHALKASSDPPVHGGKSKIDIATEAWNDQSFHLPGKAELLGDFILTRFAKDKDIDS